MEDEKILRLIAQDDEKGLYELQKKYQPFIEYLLRGTLSKYPQDMEECLNDVKLKLWNGLKTYDNNKSSLKTFITHIVRNTAIDRIRQISRREHHIDKNLDVIEESDRGNECGKSAEEIVFLEEQKQQVLEGINKLKNTDKEIFLRKYYYLQSVAQIAAELDRSEKSIEGKLSRIRKKLKSILKEV